MKVIAEAQWNLTHSVIIWKKSSAYRDMPFGADALVFKALHRMFALVAWQAEQLTVSLKADPIEAVILRKQYEAVKPSYHMNKKHWITVTLNGCIPDEVLYKLIDESYHLVIRGMTRADKPRLER